MTDQACAGSGAVPRELRERAENWLKQFDQRDGSNGSEAIFADVLRDLLAALTPPPSTADAEAREAQLVADLAQVQVERDAYRAAALRCETENSTHCPEDRSCGEPIKALKAQLAALRPYVQHTPECASRCCVCGYWRTEHRFSRCAEFQSKPCSCGLASILDPPAKETV